MRDIKTDEPATVGSIFLNGSEYGDPRLHLSDNTQELLVDPNWNKTIQIPENPRPLSKYQLTKHMNDISVQNNAGNPGFMTVEEFFTVTYLLIFRKELGERLLKCVLDGARYYLHVMINGKKSVVAFCWLGIGWDLGTRDFGAYDLNKGFILLSFPQPETHNYPEIK